MTESGVKWRWWILNSAVSVEGLGSEYIVGEYIHLVCNLTSSCGSRRCGKGRQGAMEMDVGGGTLFAGLEMVINFFSLSTTRAHCALLPAALLCSALYGGCDFCELLVKLDALIVMPAGRFCIVFEVSSNSAIKSLVMAN